MSNPTKTATQTQYQSGFATQCGTSIPFESIQEPGAYICTWSGHLLRIPEDFEDRVLNIHPALLPKFGGKGFYGDQVHRAVLNAGEEESGCTVHLCNNDYDKGRILLQRRVTVSPDDDLDSLAARVFAAECEAYPAAIELWLKECR